jgi:hypothetical protein
VDNIAHRSQWGELTCGAGGNYLWLDMDTILRWIILITPGRLFSYWGRAVEA